MFTTFQSFKKAGACSDGNKRFLAMLGGTSKNLDRLDAKIPVWLPLLMNPTSNEDIGWMFRPNLTYEHDQDEFRHLFDRTRSSVLKVSLIYFLCSIHMQHERNNRAWEFAAGGQKYGLKGNEKKADALVALYEAAVETLHDQFPQTNEKLRAAFAVFERHCGTHLLTRQSEFSVADPDPGSYVTAGEKQLSALFPMMRMAITEADSGPIHASINDQIYWTKTFLRNVHEFQQWTFGVDLEFNKQPGRATNRAKLAKLRAQLKVMKKGRYEDVDEFESRRDELRTQIAQEENVVATANTAAHDPSTIWKTITQIWLHPALYGFKLYYVGEVAKPKEAKAEKIRIEKPEKKRRGRKTSDDSLTAVFAEYDSEFSDDEETVTAGPDRTTGSVDRHGRSVLRSMSSKWTNRATVIVQWVYSNFDTNEFFGRLAMPNEVKLPDTVDSAWLMERPTRVTAAVHRDNRGNFQTGILSIRSPRLMMHVMKSMKEFEDSLGAEEPMTMLTLPAPKKTAPLALPAPEPIVAQPMPTTPAPAPAPAPIRAETRLPPIPAMRVEINGPSPEVQRLIGRNSLEQLSARAQRQKLVVKFGRGRCSDDRKKRILAEAIVATKAERPQNALVQYAEAIAGSRMMNGHSH